MNIVKGGEFLRSWSSLEAALLNPVQAGIESIPIQI